MVMRYISTALLFIQLTYGYSYVDGPIEKSAKPNRMNCPGAYCGRSGKAFQSRKIIAYSIF